MKHGIHTSAYRIKPIVLETTIGAIDFKITTEVNDFYIQSVLETAYSNPYRPENAEFERSTDTFVMQLTLLKKTDNVFLLIQEQQNAILDELNRLNDQRPFVYGENVGDRVKRNEITEVQFNAFKASMLSNEDTLLRIICNGFFVLKSVPHKPFNIDADQTEITLPVIETTLGAVEFDLELKSPIVEDKWINIGIKGVRVYSSLSDKKNLLYTVEQSTLDAVNEMLKIKTSYKLNEIIHEGLKATAT